ncbi:MAG: hypothetical protein JOY60_13580 [Burkholderiaceae bacterium]|nr:hypothetical protein [Burkholderiaceae bacterium]
MAADSAQQEARQTPDGTVSPLSLPAKFMIFVLPRLVGRPILVCNRNLWVLFLVLGLLLATSLGWAGSFPTLGALGPTGHVVQSSANTCDPSIATCLPGTTGGSGGTSGSLIAGNDANSAPGNSDGAGMCKPPVNGSPKCGGGGPASQGGGDSGGVDAGGGNPINILSGKKYQQETDLPALPGVLGLELKRYYNSRSSHPGLFGAQWRFSYETVLYDRGSQLQIIQADGRRISFAKKPGAALCDSPQWSDGQVRIEYAGDKPVFHWRWPDGRVLTFRSGLHGGYPLHAIRASTGETSRLAYSPMLQLVSVTDPQNRQLLFIYDKASRLSAVITPLGRINYLQDTNRRLTEVAYLAGEQVEPYAKRIYHYEREHQGSSGFSLTGISLQSQVDGKWQTQRLSTYVYNSDNLAVLSTQGLPLQQKDGKTIEGTGIEQVQLSYLQQPSPIEGRTGPDDEVHPRSLGRTQLTNSLGQQTLIQSAIIGGHYRLIEIRGPGCATCGPSNMQYGYDFEGRLLRSTQLDAQGQPLQSELKRYDRHGRLVEVAKQRYAKGKSQAAQWIQRLAYTDTRFMDGSIALGSQPTSLNQPSVVAGKAHMLSVEYNDKGQPLRVTEEGWSPIDGQGHDQTTPFTRSTSYRYSVIGGNSVLTEIDGPMPNGPKHDPSDSDITRVEWDRKGLHIAAITRPGGWRTEWSVDAIGRLSQALHAEDMLRVQLALRYDGQSSQAWMPSGITESTWFVDAAGSVQEGSKRFGEVMIQRDNTGQLSSLDIKGAHYGSDWIQQVRDSLRQPNVGFDPREASDPVVAGVERDAWARPVSWSDAHGVHLLEASWGALGTVAQSSILSLRSTNLHAQRIIDDAGRIVAIKNPAQGWQFARYDATDRLIETRDPLGARQVAQWDIAGRLVRLQRFSPGSNRAEQTLEWHHVGRWVSEVTVSDADGMRTTSTERNSQGWVLRESQGIHPAGRLATTLKPVTMSVAYRYDGQGRVLQRSITDGQNMTLEIAQTLDGQGRLVSLGTKGWLPGWLGGCSQFVKKIDWQRIGSVEWATLIRHGDASEDRYLELSIEAPAAAGGKAVDDISEDDGLHVETGWSPPGQAPEATGRPVTIDTEQGLQRLHWNAAGELVQTSREDGGYSRYVYDAQGRRVVKLVRDAGGHDKVTLALYEQTRLLEEADAQGKGTFAYAYVGWRPVAQLPLQGQDWIRKIGARLFGAQAKALHTSASGQVQSMTQEGLEHWRQPDGRNAGFARTALERHSAVHQPLRYVGQYHDDDSGLDYHGARYYEAGIGRFISPDPRGVADSVNEVRPSYLLDLYPYAGGRPDEYFDPDGAARIRYFALTTGASGQQLGSTQGFTRARWAFIVDDVQAPTVSSGDATLDQLQQKYAGNGQSLLFDANGNFLANGQSTTTWVGGNAGVPDMFAQHYGNNLISIPAFTLQMRDEDATRLIASYITADSTLLNAKNCMSRAALLPEIQFASKEVPIRVTSGAYSQDGTTWAQPQRIVACGTDFANDVVQRRVQKYNYAAMLLESSPSQIYKDCHVDGCPGRSLDGTVLSGYVASYGQTQFIGMTMVDTLRRLRSGNSRLENADGRAVLQLDDENLWTHVNNAYAHAQYVVSVFNSHTAASPDWNATTAAVRNDFVANSGLDAAQASTIWNDINQWKRNPTPNLNNEARQSFATKVRAGEVMQSLAILMNRRLMPGLNKASEEDDRARIRWLLDLGQQTIAQDKRVPLGPERLPMIGSKP